MDPLLILKVLWRHKWVALPVFVLTAVACMYALFLGPRTYEAHQTYALAQPKLPTAMELEQNPSLSKLNQDNPYLRATDPSLLSQVVIARMSAVEIVEELKSEELSVEYQVEPVNSLTSGLVRIVVSAADPQTAIDTVEKLDGFFTSILEEVQKVNDADDMFLVQAMTVDSPYPATEVVSSRIRTVIMTGIGGLVLLFAAVSIAQSIVLNRSSKSTPAGEKKKKKKRKNSDGPANGHDIEIHHLEVNLDHEAEHPKDQVIQLRQSGRRDDAAF